MVMVGGNVRREARWKILEWWLVQSSEEIEVDLKLILLELCTQSGNSWYYGRGTFWERCKSIQELVESEIQERWMLKLSSANSR